MKTTYTLMATLLIFPAFSFAYTGDSSVSGDVVLSATGTNTETMVDVDAEADVDMGSTSTETDTETSLDVRSETNVDTDAESNSEFDAFVSSLTASENNVEGVYVDSDQEDETKLTVSYLNSGKLFGFIPVKVKSDTEVWLRADGTIKVEHNLPWWSGAVTGLSQSKSDVETRIMDRITASGAAGADANVNVNNQTEIVSTVVAELNTTAELSGSLNASE